MLFHDRHDRRLRALAEGTTTYPQPVAWWLGCLGLGALEGFDKVVDLVSPSDYPGATGDDHATIHVDRLDQDGAGSGYGDVDALSLAHGDRLEISDRILAHWSGRLSISVDAYAQSESVLVICLQIREIDDETRDSKLRLLGSSADHPDNASLLQDR